MFEGLVLVTYIIVPILYKGANSLCDMQWVVPVKQIRGDMASVSLH